MHGDEKRRVQREFYLAFWKAHILHHAGEGPVVGQWMLTELRRHGYEVSPGTLYPMLHRMEEYGWLRSETDPAGGKKTRRSFFLTDNGRLVLSTLLEQIEELHREVAPRKDGGGHDQHRDA